MRKKDLYYSGKTMRVYENRLSRFLNKYLKNYSREEVAAGLGLHGKDCLDIACGDGTLLNGYLHKRYERATGIDISSELIRVANSKKKKNCKFMVDDIEMYVEKAIKEHIRYDDIYMLAILEHIKWPTLFLSRVRKILKNGGRLVIEVPNTTWLPYRLRFLLGKFPVTAPTVGAIPGVYDEHIRFFTFETLDEMLVRNKFKFLKFDCSGKFRKIKSLFPSMLSPDIVAVYEK